MGQKCSDARERGTGVGALPPGAITLSVLISADLQLCAGFAFCVLSFPFCLGNSGALLCVCQIEEICLYEKLGGTNKEQDPLWALKGFLPNRGGSGHSTQGNGKCETCRLVDQHPKRKLSPHPQLGSWWLVGPAANPSPDQLASGHSTSLPISPPISTNENVFWFITTVVKMLCEHLSAVPLPPCL